MSLETDAEACVVATCKCGRAVFLAVTKYLDRALRGLFDNSCRADWPDDLYDAAEAALAQPQGGGAVTPEMIERFCNATWDNWQRLDNCIQPGQEGAPLQVNEDAYFAMVDEIDAALGAHHER